MNWSEFENNMKDGVDAHQTPVDTEALWDKLQQKRRKPLLFWWWLSAAGLSVSALLFWMTGQKLQTADTQTLSTPMPAVVAQKEQTQLAEPQKMSIDHSQKLQAAPGTSSNTTVGLAAVTTTRIAHHVANAPASHRSLENGRGKVQEVAAVSVATSVNFSGALATQAEAPVATTRNVPENAAQQIMPPTEQLQENSGTGLDANTVPIPTASPTATGVEPVKIVDVKSELSIAKIELPISKTSATAQRLGLILGYDRWQETGDLPFHQSVSRPMESISLALLRSKPFAKHWSLQTGMAYARTTRQVSREIIGKTFKPKTTINYFADGSTYIDSIYVAVEYTRHIRHYNVWRQIGIPVSLQYRLAIGQGLLLPQVGFQASLLSAKGIGFIKDGDTDAQIFKNQYQQQILLQAHAGFDWMFDLGEICSVSIGPRFQFDLTPRSSKSVKQKEYFWQCGVQLGVWRNLR